LDITKQTDVDHAIEHAIHLAREKGLRFTGLINNAGITGKFGEPIEWKPLDEIRQTMDVNFFGTIRVTIAALPELRRNHGRIIVISSIAGKLGPPVMSDYGASKAALNSMFSALRRELYDAKVAVSVIQAGCVKSPIWGKARGHYNMLKERAKVDNATHQAYRYILEPWSTSDVGGLCELLAPYANSSTSPAIVHAMTSRYPQTFYCTSDQRAPGS
jgi:NAD(P)-dependent dehydrogenase (short-subunit alcohol dehydrogenase family)